MHLTRRERGLRLGAFIMLALATQTLNGQEPVPPPRPVEPPPAARSSTGALIVPIGVSQTLKMTTRKAISTVRLNVDGIVRVAPNAIDPTSVVLTGLASGTVRLFLTDVDNKEETFDVIVQLDVAYVKRMIAEAVPTANVDVKPVLNRTVILTGWVARAEDVETILAVARTVIGTGAQVVNAMQVGGVQQVQLDVTVAQVNRTEIRRRGFAFAYDGNGVSFGSIIGGLAGQGQGGAAAAAGGVGIRPGAQGFQPTGAANVVFGIVGSNVQLLLQALRDENLAKLLAEPKLVTLSGRPAHFLSGGQQAVLSPTTGLGGAGVTFRDVGTELDFVPIVLGNGRIYLEVAPVVRSVNINRGINVGGAFTPGFDEQSVRTAIELEPGQTMAIGGLIQTQVSAISQKVPVLGDLPFLGALFSSVTHQSDEIELVILVTPHLVDGQDCKQAPKRLPGRETRSPDDYELFLESLLEAPRGQRQVFENGQYKAAYKNDPSFKQFPCADPLPREPRDKQWGRKQWSAAGNCDACAPGMAPQVPVHNGGALPPPVLGPAPGASDARMIPPQPMEALPGPQMGPVGPVRTTAPVSRPATRRASPLMPAPYTDDEPPK